MQNLKVDIVVMGSGGAGLTAAVTALDYGASVACFEKRPFQAGSVSNCAIGVTAVKNDPRYQAAAFNSIFNYTNYNGDPGVIKAWINNTWRILPFMDKIGAKYKLRAELPLEKVGKGEAGGFPPQTRIGDAYYMIGRGKGHGSAIVALQSRRYFEAHGGHFFVDTPIVDIFTEDGKVCGVLAKHNKTGEEYKVECKAVIVASGGFGNDREMIKKYIGHNYTDNNCSNGGDVLFNFFPTETMTGDGHKLCWKLGGAKGGMGINGHNLVPGPGIIGNTPWIAYDETRVMEEQPYFWVNKNGERFVDESQSSNHMAMGTSIARQPGKMGYIIYDDDTREYLETHGPDFEYFIFQAEHLHDIKGQFERLAKLGNEHAFMTDTLEELADKAGIDKEGLLKNVARYNYYCDQGRDGGFSKNPKFMRPVRKGPFYALRVFNAGYSTVGGIKVNGRMEVINDDGKPIPGLYSAGDCMVGELWGNPPVGGIGNYSHALGFGFAAADSACEYIGIKEEEL